MPAPPTIDLGSGINTQETIQKLIELERQPLKRLGRDNAGYGIKIKAWESLRSFVKDLSEKSRDLYSITSSFYKRLLVSSDPEALSGTALNGAPASRKKVQIDQLASHHEIHSKSLKKGHVLPAGSFSVRLGKEKKQNLRFEGGKLEAFKDFLAEKLGPQVDLALLDSKKKENVLKLYSRQSGKKGRLEFEDPQGLLAKAGLVEKRRQQESLAFDATRLSADGGRSSLRYTVKKDGKALEWSKGSLRLDLKEPYEAKKGASLILRFKGKKAPPPPDESLLPHKTEETEPGPEISAQVGDVKLLGKHIKRERSVVLEGFDFGEPRVRSRITFVYEHKGKKKSKSFSRSLEEGQAKNWKLDLSRLPNGAEIKALRFHTNGESEVEEPYFESPEEMKPVHEVQAGQDALVKIDGVPFSRSKNTEIKDLISGASLTLKGVTKKPVKVEIKADTEAVLKQIKEWVKSYNTMQSYVRESSRSAINHEIAPPSAPRQRRDRKQGAFFATDSTTRQLANQSYSVIASAYPAEPRGFRVLAEIGISTGKIGSRWQDINEGLLKLDEGKLKDALAKSPGGLQKLFASDNNKDRRLDNGAAFKMEKTLKPYAQTNHGLISVRIELLKSKISSNKDRIFRQEEMLSRKKENLRRKFGRMEQAVKRSRSMGDYLKRVEASSRSSKE